MGTAKQESQMSLSQLIITAHGQEDDATMLKTQYNNMYQAVTNNYRSKIS